ncbi:hypothetical protein A2Z00_00515, partial [Candidatus Gottesmanbacteria bacterium RBG_13_45_10]
LLFGKNIASVVGELPLYTLAMVLFTVASGIVSYHQIRKEYIFPVVGFLLTIAQVTGLVLFHNSLSQVVVVMFGSALLQLIVMTLLHIFREQIRVLIVNTMDFLGLFSRITALPFAPQKLRILIFNWRDTNHVWGGGAEAYIHELAKQWIHMGHSVTLFCGNDGKTPRNQVVDGVRVIRRGGFYTVYVWAFLYYMVRFRGKYDVVVDSENGIPFFTPLYVKEPIFLLIHHVHQDVFRIHLTFPLRQIATFIESTLMPKAYRNNTVITVSESSKKEILRHNLAREEHIRVVTPGVNIELFEKREKTEYPSVLYLGRLKAYKNIDVAIRAFANVYRAYPDAKLVIAGEGEHMSELKKTAGALNLNGSVRFTGRVTEKEKLALLATSWVAVQPSSFEGWSLAVLEANACGTPVIASDVYGLRDSVVNNQTGLLVPPRNDHALAESMELLIANHALRKKFSVEAHEWSRSFSWEKSAQDFIEYITGILQQQKKPIVTQKDRLSLAEAKNI